MDISAIAKKKPAAIIAAIVNNNPDGVRNVLANFGENANMPNPQLVAMLLQKLKAGYDISPILKVQYIAPQNRTLAYPAGVQQPNAPIGVHAPSFSSRSVQDENQGSKIDWGTVLGTAGLTLFTLFGGHPGTTTPGYTVAPVQQPIMGLPPTTFYLLAAAVLIVVVLLVMKYSKK